MMDNPKISIIIPVYNAESYIDRCLDSIANQTFCDYEVILVDDGSLDRSGDVCEEYAKHDTRIKVYHKENEGVSKTRQFGLEHSRGEYVIHIDPDDWVESSMLEGLYDKAIKENVDMVICDFFMNEKKESYIKQEPKELSASSVLNELFINLHGSCCNKLVRRSCFEKYSISFPSTFNLYEDLYVNACLLCNDIKIAYLNKAYYHYMISVSDTSVTKRIDKKSLEEDREFVRSMCLLLEDKYKTKELFLRSLSYSIILKAYKSKAYTTSEFVEEFRPYRRFIFSSRNGNFIAKCVCFLSCLGLYGLLKHLY